jgi:alpha-beta hydrolase superfamily lysophospholipase
MLLPFLAVAVLLTWTSAAGAASTEKLDVSVRGRTVTLTIYRPKTAPRGTIIMGSGDVGWVGLAASMAEELSAQGYNVVGVNARQYLASFTSGKDHVQPKEVSADFQAFVTRLKEKQLLVRPVVLSGVSEGAALAVLAASDPRNHSWIDGVITMGLPATAELAWRWTDLWASATRRDADEPFFTVTDVLPAVSPVPLCMIQSMKDEYVSPADYARFKAVAKEPRQLVLIDASNHRFTDRRPELTRAFAAGLDWIARTGKR